MTLGLLFDLNSPVLKRSLSEAIAWCTGQIGTVCEEPEEIKRRRGVVDEAYRLRREAYAESDRLWFRLFRGRSKLRRAEMLLRQADVGTLPPPLCRQLRTAGLISSSFSFGEARADQEREQFVRQVVANRSDLLRARGLGAGPSEAVDFQNGRLLVYVPSDSLSDGAAQYASMGFFDADNAPPWDTWVAFSVGRLLSWVPALLVKRAQDGIEVNPEECIAWLS